MLSQSTGKVANATIDGLFRPETLSIVIVFLAIITLIFVITFIFKKLPSIHEILDRLNEWQRERYYRKRK